MKFLKYKIKKLINDKINHIRLDYEVILNNKIIKKDFCNSFNGNFLQWIYAGAGQNDSNFIASASPFNSAVNVLSASGTAVNATSGHNYFRGDSGSNVYNGIIVSSDTSAPQVNSYTILSKINNGSGGGQLVYTSQQGSGIVFNGNTASISLYRTFINNSGADIIVNKFYWYGNASYKFIEELIQGTTVPNTKSLSIKINLSITT
jgi:hypothetical protein